MNKFLQKWILAACILLPLGCAAEKFVQLTAEIDFNTWDWWFFCDNVHKYPGEQNVPSIFHSNYFVHCVIGTNTWLMEYEGPKWKNTCWFNGTNIIEHTVSSNVPPYTEVSRSADGNPGHPVRAMDRMTAGQRIPWLAFCSGAALRRDDRKIYPPDDFWKESRLALASWTDKIDLFKDSLGLPASINLLTTNNESIMQYQTRQSTNMLGWNFPVEFYLVQYRPGVTNEGWKLDLTAKGRITFIGVTTNFPIPIEPLHADWVEK